MDYNKFHIDVLNWKASLQLVEEKFDFLKQLLKSGVYNHKSTIGITKRLQFEKKLHKLELRIITLKSDIAKHENLIGCMLDDDLKYCEDSFIGCHERVELQFEELLDAYKILKSKIISLTGVM